MSSPIPHPRWRLVEPPDPGLTRALADALRLPFPVAALLVQRGVTSEHSAREFLRPALSRLSDPHALHGVRTAVEIITDTVRRGETILVHGDYDVDGQCATAVLVRALRAAGARVHGFVPHRIRDGYDFGPAGLAEARRVGAALVITCDCGITAVEAVAAAKAEGRRVIVTDHHLPGAELPDADAVIDPQQAGDTSGLRMLSGTGVAFKLVQALARALELPPNFSWYLLDLVALATIADVVPLVGENRILVKHGLRLLADSTWQGLRALLAASGVDPAQLRAGQVGFVVAPRLNAAGRMGDASTGLALLLTDDATEAARLAADLEELNRRRQAVDQAILDQALRQVEERYADPVVHRALVLDGEGWHPGVIGIVASRIVERYGRPVFLVATENGVGKGSGRSIERFDLHAALADCADLLDRWGGHHMAAGLTIQRDRVEEFRQRFNAVAKAQLAVEDLGPEQRVDLEIAADAVSDDLERWGRHLEPCGMGNPAPVFGIRQVQLAEARVVGSNHLKAKIAAGQGKLDVIAFNWWDRAASFSGGDVAVDVAFRLERNTWRDRTSLQARVLSLAVAS